MKRSGNVGFDDYKKIYDEGIKAFKNSDFYTAKEMFSITKKDPSLTEKSNFYLCKIPLNTGNYRCLREMLNSGLVLSNYDYHKLFAILEDIEFNFDESKAHLKERMNSTDNQFKGLLYNAKYNLQMGNFDIAQNMFETLQFNPKFFNAATMCLIDLMCRKRDFKEAERLHKSIDESNLSPAVRVEYRRKELYIKYYLGELRRSSKGEFNENKNYMLYRLFDPSEDVILRHIERRHIDKDGAFLGFFKNTNIKSFVGETLDRMKYLNPKFVDDVDKYEVKYNRPIGYCYGEVTDAVCVTTILGTKEIITMYPVVLSDEFDKEGYSTSKRLKYKRIQGRMMR